MTSIVIMPCGKCGIFCSVNRETIISVHEKEFDIYCSEDCAPPGFRRLKEAEHVAILFEEE